MSDLATCVGRAVGELPVIVVWLFGSRARGEERADSDTDLAVLVPSDTSLAERFDLRLRLAERCAAEGVQRPDVVMVNDAPLRLKARVSSEGRVVLSRDEAARIAWTSRIFREHADFALLQDQLDRQMLRDHVTGRR